jgi:hypothetical protein
MDLNYIQRQKKDRKNMNHVEKDSPEEGKRYFIQKWRAQQHLQTNRLRHKTWCYN